MAMPRILRFLPTLLGLLLLAGAVYGINAALAARAEGRSQAEGEAKGEAGAEPAPRALPVRTAPLQPVTHIDVPRSLTGTIAARRRVELAFEGNGRVEEILVDEGDVVAEGAPLASLDVERLEAGRAEVESRRVRLQAQLDELLAGPRKEVLDAARADVAATQEELAFARLQLDRRRDLAERGNISVEQLDTSSTQVRTLEARLASAEAQLSELENGSRAESIAAQRGALGEVDAALLSIDVQITKATLAAPFAGTIEARLVDEGAVVSEQMPRSAFVIVETDALEARIGLPVELVDSAGLDAVLRVRGERVEVSGVRILPTVDPATRTVTAVFELAPAASTTVRHGDVVSMEIQDRRESPGAWIPLAALSESARGLWTAFAAEGQADGTWIASRLEVEVLHAEASRAFVRGTFDGETAIVLAGGHRLVNGQAIVPIESEAGGASAAE